MHRRMPTWLFPLRVHPREPRRVDRWNHRERKRIPHPHPRVSLGEARRNRLLQSGPGSEAVPLGEGNCELGDGERHSAEGGVALQRPARFTRRSKHLGGSHVGNRYGRESRPEVFGGRFLRFSQIPYILKTPLVSGRTPFIFCPSGFLRTA